MSPQGKELDGCHFIIEYPPLKKDERTGPFLFYVIQFKFVFCFYSTSDISSSSSFYCQRLRQYYTTNRLLLSGSEPFSPFKRHQELISHVSCRGSTNWTVAFSNAWAAFVFFDLNLFIDKMCGIDTKLTLWRPNTSRVHKQYSSWRIQARFAYLRAAPSSTSNRSSWCRWHISKLFIDEKRHRFTPDYAVTRWRKGIQIRLRGTFEDEA
jgi:hypothetical protein